VEHCSEYEIKSRVEERRPAVDGRDIESALRMIRRGLISVACGRGGEVSWRDLYEVAVLIKERRGK
jgi:hypothetical protein